MQLQEPFLQVGLQPDNSMILAASLYAARVINFQEMKASLKDKKDATTVRQISMSNYDISLKLKLALYYWSLGNSVNDTLHRYNILDDSIFKIALKHRKRIKEVAEKIGDVPSIQQADKKISDIVRDPKIKTFVSKFVYRKLRGFASINRFENSDFENDLMAKAIETFYYVYPNFTDAHIINYMKRSIHHTGIRYISHFTTGKRNRYIQTEDGYNSIVQTFEKIDGTDLNSQDSALVFVPNYDLSIMVQKANRNNCNVVKALTLQQCDEFVTYYNLQSFGKRKKIFETTMDVFNDHYSIKAYTETIMKFGNLTNKQLLDIIMRIRQGNVSTKEIQTQKAS
jgi:hypothetical protein